ncbi:acyl CoA binding protein-domain-containing protein [Mycena haematopus]|nr:acyl CoA binding protein-domain-containing protein [Mycena haematopus]
MAKYTKAQFDKATAIVETKPTPGEPQVINPSQEDKLYFYGRFKYVTVGTGPTSARPWAMDFVGRAKWDAWEAAAKSTVEEAQHQYVERLVAILQAADRTEELKQIGEPAEEAT